jgi:RimJ/RimL family protein N-acetyltransferase
MAEPDLAAWHGVPAPEPIVLSGRYGRLEPLEARHAPDLWAVQRGSPELLEFLPDPPPHEETEVRAWVEATVARTDLLMWAVLDQGSGRAGGRQALMRIDPANGVAEIGHILWGAGVARSRVATEAIALHAGYLFDALGYRRLEWKCDARNEPSRRAAVRLGFRFEGVFAQHMVVKGRNRDTAWYAMLDRDWPAQRERFAAWLEPANFEPDGRQRTALQRG